MSTDLHAGLAFSLHALGDSDLKSETLREIVIDAAMDEDRGYGDALESVIKHLLHALADLRSIELNEIDEDDEQEAAFQKLQYPDDPVAYFFQKYREVAKRNDHAFTDEDIWWPDSWPTDSIWEARDLDYLAVLTVGKDKNTRRAMIEYMKEHHPEMLNPEKKEQE